MLSALFGDARREAVLLLFSGALGLLGAVLAMTRSIVADDRPLPGRRALLHWLPIAALALVATAMGHAEMGLGLVFGTSVAVLSAVAGFVLLAAPLQDVPEEARRLWPFLPAPALLVFLLGFGGTVGLSEAGYLALQGLAMLLLWSGAPTDQSQNAQVAVSPFRRLADWGFVVLALALLAAWVATRGAQRLQAVDGRYPTAVTATTLLSLVLALPMISTGVPLAVQGRAWAPLTAQVGVVFLNLGLLLPAIIVLAVFAPGAGPADATPLLYPRIAWRIDAVAMLILSLLLVPASLGKVKLDRSIACWLIGGYCVYLLAVLVLGSRG